MASCEKCWSDAGRIADGGTERVDEYRRLIEERDCTPEEQAGPDRTDCPQCGRNAVHQWAKICVACGAENL